MVFCNNVWLNGIRNVWNVTILILIDGFLQYKAISMNYDKKEVTILILIDGFLQFNWTYIGEASLKLSQSLF